MHFFLEQVRPTEVKKFQDDINIEDRPYIPTGFETTKETQDDDVPADSPEPGCSKIYYSPSVLGSIAQPG
jgi:hypothetical protein